MKYAEVPIDHPQRPQISIPEDPMDEWEKFYSCREIAQLIATQYPKFSLHGQLRLVQKYAKALNQVSEIKLKKYGFTKNDVTPRKISKTPYYTRRGVIAILETMGYGVPATNTDSQLTKN